MSNNKQSSVEWLMGKLIEHQIIKVGQTTYGGKVNYKHEILLEQAKEIHRVEIIESYASGSNDRLRNTINTNYYNETFENTK